MWVRDGNRQPHEKPKSDRKSTRLNSSHGYISYAVFCLKKKKQLSVTSHLRLPQSIRAVLPMIITDTYYPTTSESAHLEIFYSHTLRRSILMSAKPYILR